MRPRASKNPDAGSRNSWRLLDTGAMSAADNIAIDAMLLSMRSRGAIPDTLRMLTFSRPTVLIGYNQSPEAELRLDYCRSNEIEINRRVTGGGAVYIDPGQMGWELIASRRSLPAGPSMSEVTAFVCAVVSQALNLLGVDAAFRPRNDIEVEGRKICGTGGAWEGDAILFQGTLLIDYAPEEMIRSLRIPTEKLLPRELSSVRERVTCLAELIDPVPGRDQLLAAFHEAFQAALGVEFLEGGFTPDELDELERLKPVFSSREWVWHEESSGEEGQIMRSLHRGEGGTIRVSASVDAGRRIVRSALFRGDYFVSPPRAAYDLEAALKNCPIDRIGVRLREFFAEGDREFMGLGAKDFHRAIEGALAKLFFMERGMKASEAEDITLVGDLDVRRTLARATMLLLPYCAKAPWCEYRSCDGCEQCGDCSVGEAYAMASEWGLEVVCINDYDHLVCTLDRFRNEGVEAYIGCCCHAFLIKRYRTFDRTGVPGLLVDIEDTTCYDLSREQEAYSGKFDQQTRLKLELLKRLLPLTGRKELAMP